MNPKREKSYVFVFGADRIYQHFFGNIYPGDPLKAARETYKVEAFISREFVKNAHGHVFTAVCGANKTRPAITKSFLQAP